ncbi:MAG: hypothetical protein MPJ22_00685 [Pirellulales bacterium]|nr:hypothetical protein [Pirellulales bacterium]MDA8040925.1 hypothetical protein [Pirellulales bacterium]
MVFLDGRATGRHHPGRHLTTDQYSNWALAVTIAAATFGAAILFMAILVDVADGATTGTTTTTPKWVIDLVKHLDGQPITDPEFWTSVQNLITSRLNSQYAANHNINIIIQDTVPPSIDSETLEINLKRVRVVGLDTQRDTLDLLVEFDMINLGDTRVDITDLRYTLHGDARLLAAGSDGADFKLEPITKKSSQVVVVVERNGLTSAEMVSWFNQIDVWVFEGAARTGTAEWDEFRSVA